MVLSKVSRERTVKFLVVMLHKFDILLELYNYFKTAQGAECNTAREFICKTKRK